MIVVNLFLDLRTSNKLERSKASQRDLTCIGYLSSVHTDRMFSRTI